ncbi:MAG: heme-binding domain-containing protein [Bacteroidales bacterium]|nr:heme-binding domain-containing protein [Bacteroidales bacterium]
MRKILTTMIILAGGLIFMSFAVVPENNSMNKSQKANLVIPNGVHSVIMQHCFMCHNMKSRGVKSKEKLNFDLLTHMELPTIVAKLQNISDAVNNDKMPPKKFLEHHPEKALNAYDKSLLTKWAVASADSLLRNK